MKKHRIFLLLLIPLLRSGCNSVDIMSFWRRAEIKIDGKTDEWEGKTWISKDMKNVLIGFMNDDKYLYAVLTISDRSLQRRIWMTGATFWFDRNGGEEKKFGFRYPCPAPAEFQRPGEDRQTEGPETGAPDMFNVRPSDEIEIYGPAENEVRRIRTFESGGIEIAVGHSYGLLVFEMKIPLADTGIQSYVIGAAPGRVIGVGIEAGKMERGGKKFEKPGFGGGRDDIGRPDRGPDIPEGPEGPETPGGKPGSVPEPISFWGALHLASGDTPAEH